MIKLRCACQQHFVELRQDMENPHKFMGSCPACNKVWIATDITHERALQGKVVTQ